MSKITTSGDLRRALADTITDLRTGAIDVSRASAVAQVAKEITASMQVEVNVAKVRQYMFDVGKDMGQITQLGQMVIEGATPPKPQPQVSTPVGVRDDGPDFEK